MIQRKQTIYLIIVIILMALTFVLPSSQGIIESKDHNYYDIFIIMPFSVEGISPEMISEPTLFSTTYLGSLICIIIIWAGFIISRYKNRWLQIRLTVFFIIWLIVVEVLMCFYGYKLITELDKLSDVKNGFPMTWGALLPLISILLSFLAFRGILKDELLIKSLNSNRMR